MRLREFDCAVVVCCFMNSGRGTPSILSLSGSSWGSALKELWVCGVLDLVETVVFCGGSVVVGLWVLRRRLCCYWGLCFCAALALAKALFCVVSVVVELGILRRLCFATSLFLWGSGFSDGGIWCASKEEPETPTPVTMENGHHLDNVAEDEEDVHHEEENEVDVQAVDDPVVRNGIEDASREHEIRLNAIGFEAEVLALPDPIATTATDPIQFEVEDGHHEEEDEMNVAVVDDPNAENGVEHERRVNAIGFDAEFVALPDPIAINLGTATDPIEVGDLPVHGFEFKEILLSCPPLQPSQEEEEG